MKTWTQQYTLASTITGDTSSGGVALLKGFLNDSVRTVANIRGGKWPWMTLTRTVLTNSGSNYVTIPNSIRKISSIAVTVGTQLYPVTPIYDIDRWNLVQASNLGTSSTPVYVFVQGRRIYFGPSPATSGNVVTIVGRAALKDMSIDDYTAGSITSINNGGTLVTGTGTTWTRDMVGRSIRITETDADGGGDEAWYGIADVTSTTTLLLDSLYEGNSISGGTAAYIIGQTSPIPTAYDMAPIYRAVALYWDTKENQQLSTRFWKLYDGGQESGLSRDIGGLIGQMIENETETVEGVYIPPQGNWYIDPNEPPRYPLTGF